MDQSQHDENKRPAGDLLVGAPAIKSYLVDDLGWPPTTDPYYLKRTDWPIGNTAGDGGGKLIASKARLARHTQKLAAAS